MDAVIVYNRNAALQQLGGGVAARCLPITKA